MKRESLLVLERKPRNAALLARASGLDLNVARSPSQFQQAFSEVNPLVCALEITRTEPTIVLSLVREVKRSTQSAVIVMPEFAVGRSLDGLILEAGANAIFASMLDLGVVSRLMKKCRRCYGNDGIDEETEIPIQQWVRDRMPWKRFASGQ